MAHPRGGGVVCLNSGQRRVKSVTAGYRCVGGVHMTLSRTVNQSVLPLMTHISAHAVFLLHFAFLGVQTVVGGAAMLLAGRA